jgi:hypothetical protein
MIGAIIALFYPQVPAGIILDSHKSFLGICARAHAAVLIVVKGLE